MNDIATLYSKNQQGGELPFFAGKQYGSGWLRTIARLAFPILKRLGIIAANTASDVIMKDQKILPSLKQNVQNALGFDKSSENSTIDIPINKKRKKHSKKSMNKRRKLIGTIFQKS